MVYRHWLIAGTVVLLAGCGMNTDDPSDEEVPEATAALHMMVDAEGASRVTATDLTITECDGQREVVSERVAVDAATHEVMVPSYVRSDDHLYVEEYRSVPPGCYDIEVELVGGDGTASSLCSAAVGRGIEVADDDVEEVMLYSRCGDVEEADVRVEQVWFDPGFRIDCDESVRICASVDGNGSAIEINWHVDGTLTMDGPVESRRVGPRRRHVECTSWVPEESGETVGRLEAFPARAETTDDGETVLFYDTHEVSFPVYAECSKQRQTELIQRIEQPAE